MGAKISQFPQLQGTMLPVSMEFRTKDKLLSDPPLKRDRPFAGRCKLCWEMGGHEAFECMVRGVYDSKPSVPYRELYGLGVVDANGIYI